LNCTLKCSASMEGQQIRVTCFVERGEIIGLSADMGSAGITAAAAPALQNTQCYHSKSKTKGHTSR
jgi:hypothetical protein